MAGASSDCTSITVSGIDFSGVSNLVSSKLIVTKNCCGDAGDAISLVIDPGDGETQDVTSNVAATGTLTLSANLTDGDTVTIGAKTYTFQDTLTDVDGNVHIGATASDTIDNFVAAITGGDTAGTDYASSMTTNTQVTAINGIGDTMAVTAITAGSTGNTIATTETSSTASWAEATLTGGGAGTTITIYADDLDQGDEGDTLSDGVYNVVASWTYTNSDGINVTQTDKTCILVDCTLRCSVNTYIQEYLNGDRTKDKDTARNLMLQHYALTYAISCEKCDTACSNYTSISTLLDDDCQCQ